MNDRDEFAAAALTAIIMTQKPFPIETAEAVTLAYQYADEMVKCQTYGYPVYATQVV